MNLPLSGPHKTAYDAVFQHPVSRNLKWADLRSMLVWMADSVQEDSDKLKLIRQGKSLTLHRPARNGMGNVAELMKVRQFLEVSNPIEPQPAAAGVHLLVVIDHRVARVYETQLHGALPQRIVPLDADGAGRHLHNVEDDSNGQRKPEQKSFYEAVSKAIANAARILIFGSGTGASSAMEHLLAHLKTNHPAIDAKVIGSRVVDEQHLTENQLLAKAREFYATQAE